MFTLPDLPYEYSSLEPWIDKETMTIHHQKHHQAYIDNLNKALEGHEEFSKLDISELITKLDLLPEDIRQKVRNNAGGHYNHSLFWQMLTPSQTAPDLEASEAISQAFGSMEKFKDEFSIAGLAHFGSGWVWLINDNNLLKIVTTPNQNNPRMENPVTKILLGLDLWEHAYYLKYQNKRTDYINNWWNIVNWGFRSS